MNLIIQANQCSVPLRSILLALGPDVLILIDALCSECFLLLLRSYTACMDFHNTLP